MADFTYTAKRQIKTGHTVDTVYTITIDLQQLDGGLPKKIGAENTSLDGSVVGVLHRIDRLQSIQTDLVAVSGGTPDPDDFDEFFSSVANMEVFTFNDGVDHDAILVGDASKARQGIYFTYSFTIRLI